ncbi:putative replicase [Jimsystermes virus]|uniref:RNA-directed RNA polymerase L n=1 Tax=Jimsystermes virus TaxID=2796600 RepID=A0AAE7PGF3_9MONO|nr:putative replicase [Jimsystermes virus]QQM16270.1 putative replicase [Jimsystermes virus]
MDDYFFEEELGDFKVPVQKVPDSHLQSPIRSVYRDFLVTAPNRWPGFLSRCLLSMPIDRFIVERDSEFCYGELLSSIYHYRTSERLEWVTQNYPECSQAVTNFINVICKKLSLPEPRFRQTPTDKDIVLISIKVSWDEIRTLMQELRMSTDTWREIQNLPPMVLRMIVCSQYALLKCVSTPDKWYVFDYDQVMMVADTIASRVFSLIYNDLLPSDIPGKIQTGVIETCYRIYDIELSRGGNAAYSRIARWEPICMSVLLSRFDRLHRASSYLTWIQNELDSDQDKSSKKLLAFLQTADLTAHMVSELHGLYRHWGHPTVQEELGCEKVRDIAQHRPVPDLTTLTRMAGALKRQFIMSFLSKHGRWPRVTNHEIFKGKPIYELMITQSRVFNFYSPEYPLEDWGCVRFGKEFDFDYHPDYTDLLDDRSISVKRSEIRSIYSSDALGYKVKRPSTDRRVLREVLRRPTVKVKEICDQVQMDWIPDEWKIIIVHAKEREMKLAPRLFAMMTFEMRLYYSVTEANIKDHILVYFPQQTMTLDEADLSKRLYTLTSSLDDSLKILSALLGIDFSSWNICWTFLSTLQVFQFLDDLFGTPGLFLRSHPFFESCLVSLASHHNPPISLIDCPIGEPTECNELWYNHRGGFEGLRQKGWTLCTIGMLLLVESMTGLKSYIIGQGDNQVCKLMIPIPDSYDNVDSYIVSEQVEISNKVDKFINTLKDVAEKIGLHVKEEETWVGMDILTYGKEILYKGAFMPQGLKRISRLLTDVNEIYPTLHTKVSTLQTAGMACSQKSYDLITPYYLCTTEALLVISRDIYRLCQMKKLPKNVLSHTESLSFKEFLLCLSSDVGACPLLSLISFLYRGHPDPLTTYTTWLNLLCSDSAIAQQMYNWLSKRCYAIGRGDHELLVSNPCSLNLESPETISTKIRRDLETALISFTKNIDLQEIFNSASKKNDEDLFKYLLSTDPCHPRVAHEIFRNTVTGTKLSFLSKFSNTRTTQSIFGEQQASPDMIRVVQKLEIDLITYWISTYREVLSVASTSSKNLCPTRLAQTLRDDTWTPALEGKSIEGVTIPHPAHQFTVCLSPFLDEHLDYIGEKIIFMMPEDPSMDVISSRGCYPAFIGSMTKEKRSGKIYSIPQASRPLKSAERLIQLRDWITHPNSSFFKFLTSLASSRTNVPIEILEDITSNIIGGSVTHRLDDHVTKRGTLHNFRPNSTTHIYYTTDTLGRFSRGQANYNMHFQGVIHLGMSYIQLGIIHGKQTLSKYTSLRYSGDCCEEQLDDFVMKTEYHQPHIGVSRSNPLLYASVDNLPPAAYPSETSFVKFFRSTRPAEAIGFLLFSRCVSSGSVYHIGLTEASNPLISSIGVAEILGAGLGDVLYHLAKYIYMFLPDSKQSASQLFHSLHPRSLSDVATICLLPDLLDEFCSLTGFSSIPEIFCNKDGVCNLLKRVLERYLYDISTDKQSLMKEMHLTVFYPSSQVGLKRMMMMWCKQVRIITDNKVNIESLINNLFHHLSVADLIPNVGFIQAAVQHMISDSDSGLIQMACKICPFKLSNVPAQTLARDSRKQIRLPSFAKKSKKGNLSSQIMKFVGFSGTYIMYLDCSLPVYEYEVKELVRPRTATVSVDKKRLDQTYRLIGPISTAFLKAFEIIDKESWTVSGDVITLAEGEGSIAELLIRLGADRVYYNSLVDKRKLIEQRAPGLVPTCLLPFSERIKMGALTALSGGDLCDADVLTAILRSIPTSNVSLCSCDAEASGNFQPHVSNKILLAWAAVCKKSRATKGLFKTFCHNVDILANTVGTALLIYHNVKIVVPCYSSHETHEVYLVCSDPADNVGLDNIVHCHHANYSLSVTNSDALRAPLQKFKLDRIHDQPLQDAYYDELPLLWKHCMDIGFEDNAVSNLHRISLFNTIYTGQTISEWINEAEQSAYDRAVNLIQLQSGSYFGLTSAQMHPIYLPKHHILHNQVELYMTCIINCNILRSILGTKRKNLTTIINSYLTGQHDLKVGEIILYRYSLEPRTWRKAYLKNMCRLWGHWAFQTKHKCSVSWT